MLNVLSDKQHKCFLGCMSIGNLNYRICWSAALPTDFQVSGKQQPLNCAFLQSIIMLLSSSSSLFVRRDKHDEGHHEGKNNKLILQSHHVETVAISFTQIVIK